MGAWGEFQQEGTVRPQDREFKYLGTCGPCGGSHSSSWLEWREQSRRGEALAAGPGALPESERRWEWAGMLRVPAHSLVLDICPSRTVRP